jgi:hypothetical protein
MVCTGEDIEQLIKFLGRNGFGVLDVGPNRGVMNIVHL